MAAPTTPAQAQKDFPTAPSFAAFLNQHWVNQRIVSPKSVGGVELLGNNVGDQWLNWYATVSPNHLDYSLGDFEMTFFDIAVGSSLGKAVAQAVDATGQATGQIAEGTAAGLNQTAKNLQPVTNPLSGLAAIGNFFNTLGSQTTWIRVAEVVLGGVLLAFGLAHLTGADNAVFSTVKKIPVLPV